VSNPQPGGPGLCIYVLQRQGGPVIPPGTGFPFRRVLRLAGLRCRYPNPPPQGGGITLPSLIFITPFHKMYACLKFRKSCNFRWRITLTAAWTSKRSLTYDGWHTVTERVPTLGPMLSIIMREIIKMNSLLRWGRKKMGT
jgi:hypothetical protein